MCVAYLGLISAGLTRRPPIAGGFGLAQEASIITHILSADCTHVNRYFAHN